MSIRRSMDPKPILTFTLTVAIVAGCGESTVSDPVPPPQALPAVLAMVSGDGQEGKTEEPLAEPFVVRVTDDQGDGLAGVAVTWMVASGGGVWPESSVASPRLRGAALATSWTDSEGLARIEFTPTLLGWTTVTANLETAAHGHVQGSPVTFTARATTLVILISRGLGNWYDWDCPEDAVFFTLANPCSGDFVVPPGTPVEWVVEGFAPAEVASTSMPPGGAAFDSGRLQRGDRFQFIPQVAGTWEFRDRISGDTGTLTIVGDGSELASTPDGPRR